MNEKKENRNPFRRVSHISPVKDIIEYSFSRSQSAIAKKQKKRRTREEKIAATEKAKVSVLATEIITRLDNIVTKFPSIDQLHPFYREICDLLGGTDKIKKILGRISGISRQIEKIKVELIEKLDQTDHPVVMAEIRREAGGRFVSLVKKAQGDIKQLIRLIKQLKAVPDFDVSLPTVVIAGAPNVGKSSLVREISTGTPEIGEYPFTTKKIIFGHWDLLYTIAQVVDTPGLLDRPFKERNIIELQSITSIRHISDIIVFMFDLSKETALPQEEQLNLFNDIVEKFPETPFIKVLNKVDLLSPTEVEEAQTSLNQDFNISTLTKEGIPNFTIKLKEALNQVIKTNEKFKSLLQLEIAEEYIYKSDEKMDYDI